MSRTSSSSSQYHGTSRSGSAYSSRSDYSGSESESSHSSLSWNERDARRSILSTSAQTTPVNITHIKRSDVVEDEEVISTVNSIFGPPQCSSPVASSGMEFFGLLILIILLFIFLFYAGPYFAFSSFFFGIVFFIFILLLFGLVLYSSSCNKGPVCFR